MALHLAGNRPALGPSLFSLTLMSTSSQSTAAGDPDVNDDFTERLRHGGTIAEEGFWTNRAFSAGLLRV